MNLINIQERLQKEFGAQISLEEIAPNTMRIYAPFFHEDGDMISMYLEILKDNSLCLRDFGNTLMRVSYTFELDSQNKVNVLNNIVKANYGNLEDGELLIHTTLERLSQDIFQFSQLAAKVSSIDLLRRETVKSLFFERLDGFISDRFKNYSYSPNFQPAADLQLLVDYCIPASSAGAKPPVSLPVLVPS